jgi:hypothetical protein
VRLNKQLVNEFAPLIFAARRTTPESTVGLRRPRSSVCRSFTQTSYAEIMKMKCIGAATMFAMLATHYARAHRTPVPTARADETTRKAENGMMLKLNRRTATRLLEFGPNTIRAISTNRILNRSLVSFYTDLRNDGFYHSIGFLLP